MLLILIVLELSTFQKKFKKIVGNKNMETNIFRIQACDSVISRYFCIGFIEFMLKDKIFTDFTNLFSPNNI